MNSGYLSIVLHAHLPFVHHPEYDSFFEESWLFEATTECYLPLIAMLDRLQADAVDYRLTLSLSPTLLTMWQSDMLRQRYLGHLQRQLELAEAEIIRTRTEPKLQKLAEMYRQLFRDALCNYRDHYQCDLASAFLKHQLSGKLDLITTAATHGFLPLLNISDTAVRNQIKIGIDTFTACFGFHPKGFWLPECGFYPGLETILKEMGIAYFFVDSHAIANALPPPRHGVYAPIDCGNGVSAYGRDPASSHQVWSAQEGYPGDADYREYYCDIGYDLELDYISPYILDGKTRINTGIKYHRVTGSEVPKALYDPQKARLKAQRHAEDFVAKKQAQIDALKLDMESLPIIVAPYDAELFGHWWFEGPQWLEAVLRLTAQSDNGIRTVSCGDCLTLQQPLQVALPSASTWGAEGYSSHWLNESTDWIYPLIHKAGAELEKLVNELQGLKVNSVQERALNQAERSLLLAQASDWPFIIRSGTTVEYAKKRITDHLARFNYLLDAIRKNRIDERYLTALEIMDDIFPDIDFRDYAPT